MAMFIILTVVKFHKCIRVSKLIEWHATYMQSMNVSYASIKQFFKNTHSQLFEGFSLRGLSHKSISTHPVPVALSSLFCTFHPSLPQSCKTHCAVWVCLSSSFLFFLLRLPGKGTVEFGLTRPSLKSQLYPVTCSVGSPAPHLWSGDYDHLQSRCRCDQAWRLRFKLSEVGSVRVLCKLK